MTTISVQLRNGSKVEVATVATALEHLEDLWVKDFSSAYELVLCAQNSQHVVEGSTATLIARCPLVDRVNPDRTVELRNDIRDIIVSSFEGEGLDMYMVSPLAN